MTINDHYMETLEVIHTLFKHIFTGLETRWGKELAVIREQYESEPVEFTDEPCVLHWPEAMAILEERGFDIGDGMGDLTGAMVSSYCFYAFILGLILKNRALTEYICALSWSNRSFL